MHTFSNNMLAQRLALRQIQVIQEEAILHNVKDRGEQLRIGVVKQEHHAIGDVRQIGLHIGIEMVTDRHTKQPWPADKIKSFRTSCLNRGILVGAAGSNQNVIKMKPPLIVSTDECNQILAAFGSALHECDGS